MSYVRHLTVYGIKRSFNTTGHGNKTNTLLKGSLSAPGAARL